MAFTREEQRKIAHELLDMVLEINGYKEHPDGDRVPQAMFTIYGSTNGLETFVFRKGYDGKIAPEHQKVDFLPTLHFNTDDWKQVDTVRELLSRYLPEGKQNEEV